MRNFAPVSPFGVKWNEDREEFEPDAEIDAGDMKGAKQCKLGRPAQFSPEILRGLLDRQGPMSSEDLQASCKDMGVSRSSFFALLRSAEAAGIVRKSDGMLSAVSPKSLIITGAA